MLVQLMTVKLQPYGKHVIVRCQYGLNDLELDFIPPNAEVKKKFSYSSTATRCFCGMYRHNCTFTQCI